MPNLGTKMITAVDCTIVRTNENNDSKFLVQYLSTPSYFKIVNTFLGGGTRQRISRNNLAEIIVPTPCNIAEQAKIGAYFSQLDHLITLHQCKCDYLIRLKCWDFSSLNKTAWEQRKLANVVDSVDTGKSKFDKEGSSGEYPILGSTSVIGYDEEYDYEGDFILTARVGANAGSLYRHAGKVKISDNTVFIQASQNIEFLYQLLIQFDIKKLSFGTGQPLVKARELKSLELMMPTDMKEQMQIGAYFSELDNLITLHQRLYFWCKLRLIIRFL